MLHELADRAGLTPTEFRARLNDAGIGSSGHGFAWLGQARALADEIRAEQQQAAKGNDEQCSTT
jgi:superoxide dismutase